MLYLIQHPPPDTWFSRNFDHIHVQKGRGTKSGLFLVQFLGYLFLYWNMYISQCHVHISQLGCVVSQNVLCATRRLAWLMLICVLKMEESAKTKQGRFKARHFSFPKHILHLTYIVNLKSYSTIFNNKKIKQCLNYNRHCVTTKTHCVIC